MTAADLDADLDAAVERAFLFTDIVGSTPLWERNPSLMATAMQTHDRLVTTSVERFGGDLFAHTGDGIGAAFVRTGDALGAAVAAQRAFADEAWPDGCRIAIRVGLHRGTAVARRSNFFGPTLNQAARIMDAGHGGQILLSRATAEGVESMPDGLSMRHEGTHRLKGISGPVELVTAVVDGLGHEFPPLRTESVPDNRIPVLLDDLIGRDRELATIADRLRTNRLVTLVGAGGTGKTHLAIAAAGEAVARFPGGVHVVDLTTVVEGADIEPRIGETVFGPDALATPGSVVDRLVERTTAPRLLVLDNCEQVLDDVAALLERALLRNPLVHVLATSREPLAVAGELVVAVEPLVVGGGSDFAPAEALFVSQARAAVTRLGDLDPEVVTRICTRLDGLPLAIRLAAANLTFLSLNELDDRLFDVLAAPPARRRRRGAAGRHHTIEAAVTWSTRLLDDDERTVFERCSVFAGSFDIDAAVAVCADDRVDGSILPSLLGSLVDRSLIDTVFDESGNRFRMLEVVRQSVRDFDGRSAVAARHQAHFTRRAAELTPQLDREATATVIHAIEVDDDNYLAALRHCVDDPSTKAARRLAMHLHTYWEETGRLRLGLEEARRLVEPADRPSRLWRAVLGLAVSYGAMTGRLHETPRLEATLHDFAADGPDHTMIGGFFALGFAALGRADLGEAEVMFDTAAMSAHGLLPDVERQALMTAGSCASHDGRAADALDHYDRADAVPPPRQGWFDDYLTVFRETARAQADGRADPASLRRIDEALGRMHDEGLRFRTAVAAAQAAIAFDLAPADADGPDDSTVGADRSERHAQLDRWWAATLPSARRAGHLWSVCLDLELATHSLVRAGEYEGAVASWATIDAALRDAGYRLPPTYERLRERYEAVALDALDDDTVETARRRGAGRPIADLTREREAASGV